MSASMTSARALLAGAVSAGLRWLVIAPGSRSAPLVYAAFEAVRRGELELTVRVDERVAGFTALGMAAATGQPAGVVTTSGTAVANLHSAVMEAAASRWPLVVITADRPAELQGVGANQTTDQRGVFGRAPVWEQTLAAGLDADHACRAGARAVAAALGRRSGVAGPAHINIQFREPLVPGPDWAAEIAVVAGSASPNPSWGLSPTGARNWAHDDRRPGLGEAEHGLVPGTNPCSGGAATAAASTEMGTGPNSVGSSSGAVDEFLPVRLEAGPRTLVIGGAGAGPAARELAEQAGWPLVAEPGSGSWGGPNAITAGR
ncbi:MAG: hypothetical protein LBK95_20825, partial [Bifidobacteriaceae bacterium]|nr:hypothetical protein [Bifidobacteriaceae bacterium]